MVYIKPNPLNLTKGVSSQTQIRPKHSLSLPAFTLLLLIQQEYSLILTYCLQHF